MNYEKQITGALKSAIDAHGPITAELIPSAVKRILGTRREIEIAAHEAYWFLHEHPKFKIAQRTPVEGPGEPSRDHFFEQDTNGHWWEVWPSLERRAIEQNLDIHYAAVDETGTVNDDASRNLYSECWLEFGQIVFETLEQISGAIGDGERASYHETHDIALDSGGATFDEALIELAAKVREHYGDYDREPWQYLPRKTVI